MDAKFVFESVRFTSLGSSRFAAAILGAFLFLNLAVAQDSQQIKGQSESPTAPAESAKHGRLTFEKHIRPILKAHCFHCHGEDGKTESELDLRLRRLIVQGGDSGPSIVAGKASESLLYQRIEAGEMPPEEKLIPKQDALTIKRWIEQGAITARKEPETISDDWIAEEEKNFWSFQKINNPKLPVIQNRSDVRTPVDHFILAKLEKQGIQFSKDAAKRVLIRRLSFDLLGLPPSPESVEEFLADSRSDAYEKLVDRFLASPSYGERWGRHWLDIAGYADSEGFTDQDPEREFAFFYRDYVIESFNASKPFDQFIQQQLAGDELISNPLDRLSDNDIENLTATGFLRMAPDGTASGGVDRAVSTNETIADTINIVSTSLLGLTVGCARCHNHRYDPIEHEDYYRMRAIFEPALDWKKWRTPKQRQISLYTEAEKKIRSEIEKRAAKLTADRAKRQSEHMERTLFEELLVAPDEKREALQKAYKTPKKDRSKEQIDLLEEYPSIGNITTGSLYLYAEQRARRANGILAEAKKRESNFIAAVRKKQLEQIEPSLHASIQAALKVDPKKRNDQQKELAKKYPGVFVTAETLKDFDKAAADQIALYKSAAKECKKQDAKTELANLQKGIDKVRASAPKENFIRALVEPSNHQPPTFLFKRGNHNQPAEKVDPGELEILNLVSTVKIPSKDKSVGSTGRRLKYAQHLTNGKHPLVARVIVNRIWMNHFGRGIVESTADFGMLGARPTHPQLLDWLATQFMRNRWDVKWLHRVIVNSKTYRQSSARTAKLDELDPSNLWYGRMSVRRLQSEAIRDSLLSISGTSVDKMFGPPVPVKEDAVGQIVLGKQKLDGERKPVSGNNLGGEAERRSIYIQVRRTRPLAVLESFDIATVSPNCPDRNFSNVAPQSLMLMNSQFTLNYSQKLAARVAKEHGARRAQIQRAFELCFGRPVEEETLNELEEFAQQQTKAFQESNSKLSPKEAQQKGLANVCHALISSNEFIYVD